MRGKNWKWYPILFLDGWMGAFLIVFLSKHNTALRSGVMAFSEVWQGGSSCCIVLIADWGGRGNVISDWSVARVGWKFDVCRPLGISQCVWVTFCVCKRKREERNSIAHVSFVPLQYVGWLCVLSVVYFYICVYAGLHKCAFCFAKDLMLCLYHSLRPVLMCWYLIWHPSTLPHNPLALG